MIVEIEFLAADPPVLLIPRGDGEEPHRLLASAVASEEKLAATLRTLRSEVWWTAYHTYALNSVARDRVIPR